MNTYSTYGPWPENSDSDYLLSDLIEALALERITFEQGSIERPVDARSKPSKPNLFRTRSGLNKDEMSIEMENIRECFSTVVTSL